MKEEELIDELLGGCCYYPHNIYSNDTVDIVATNRLMEEAANVIQKYRNKYGLEDE